MNPSLLPRRVSRGNVATQNPILREHPNTRSCTNALEPLFSFPGLTGRPPCGLDNESEGFCFPEGRQSGLIINGKMDGGGLSPYPERLIANRAFIAERNAWRFWVGGQRWQDTREAIAEAREMALRDLGRRSRQGRKEQDREGENSLPARVVGAVRYMRREVFALSDLASCLKMPEAMLRRKLGPHLSAIIDALGHAEKQAKDREIAVYLDNAFESFTELKRKAERRGLPERAAIHANEEECRAEEWEEEDISCQPDPFADLERVYSSQTRTRLKRRVDPEEGLNETETP